MRTLHLKQAILRRLAFFSKSKGPPPHIAASVGAVNQWSNPETLTTLTRLGLRKDDWVLDYGCGAGRMAEQLWRAGVRRYVGVDINPEAIDYARANYGYPGFDYICRDEQNYDYNPKGKQADRPITIPGNPTLAFCVSVLTHLLPGEITRLLEAVSGPSTMKRVLASHFFIGRSEVGAPRLGACVEIQDGVWVKRKDNPHAVVAYREDMLPGIATALGWEIRQVEKGNWRELGPDECLRTQKPYQDYLVLSRP